MRLRTVQVGDRRLVATRIPRNSWLVRDHPDDGPHYDRMTVITVSWWGRVLYQSGWLGEAPKPSWWMAARAGLFPRARRIEFDRMQKDGSLQRHSLRLPVREPRLELLRARAIALCILLAVSNWLPRPADPQKHLPARTEIRR